MKTLSAWLKRKKAGPKLRKQLPKVSRKRMGELIIYHRMLPGWLAKHRTCEIGPVFHAAGIMVKCNRITRHPHHIKGRVGKLLYEEENLLASCEGECHPQAVHFTHKDIARQLGLLQ